MQKLNIREFMAYQALVENLDEITKDIIGEFKKQIPQTGISHGIFKDAFNIILAEMFGIALDSLKDSHFLELFTKLIHPLAEVLATVPKESFENIPTFKKLGCTPTDLLVFLSVYLMKQDGFKMMVADFGTIDGKIAGDLRELLQMMKAAGRTH